MYMCLYNLLLQQMKEFIYMYTPPYDFLKLSSSIINQPKDEVEILDHDMDLELHNELDTILDSDTDDDVGRW